MRTFRRGGSPFLERPFFSDLEIDQMCEEALQKVGLLLATPEPIRIERFIEKCFGVSAVYEDLPIGVLGFTTFSKQGVESIHIAKVLDAGTKVSERRLNSTLAHEAGHGLMHAYLFAFQDAGLSIFGSDPNVSSTKVLCRDEDRPSGSSYDGRWWELQANKAIGSLLLPRPPVQAVLAPFLVRRDSGKGFTIDLDHRENAARVLSEAFEVNPVVSRLRIDCLYPSAGRDLI